MALSSLYLRIHDHPPGLEFEDIEGVRSTTAKKLKEAGIVSVMDLVVTNADELAVDINSSKESAAAFMNKSAIYPTLGIVLGFTALLMGPCCSDTEAELSLQKKWR
jgi:hypothetical protein